jgi:hypothetical protein
MSEVLPPAPAASAGSAGSAAPGRAGGAPRWRRLRALPRWWWLVAFALLYVVPYYPKVQSANELPRAYLVKAIVDHHRVSIDESVARWGTTADVSPWRGRAYSNKAPGTSLLTAPVYAASELLLGGEPSLAFTVWLGRLVTGLVPTGILLALLPGFLARYGVSAAVTQLVTVLYALGSMAMPYSLLFIAHQPSAVAVAAAWMLAQRVADEPGAAAPPASGRSSSLPPAVRLLLAGFAAGWAPLLDYQAAFALPPLALWLGWQLWSRPDRLRLFVAAAAGAALPIAALLGYHALAFDSPWRTGYDTSVTFAVYHQQGFLGITKLRWIAFHNSMVGADNGLLTFAPWLLLALPGLVLLWRRGRRGEAVTLGAIAALYILFLSSITFWRGGWQLGPRYIVVMLPLLLPPIAVAAEAALRHRAGAIAVLAAGFFGVIVHAASCAQFPYFPERFRNPVHEVTLRLWAEGLAAPNPLRWLGVPGAWSLAPYVVAVALAVGLSARAAVASWRPVFFSALLAFALLAALGLAPRSGAGGEAAFQWIRSAMTSR